jgi:hypothetical protein
MSQVVGSLPDLEIEVFHEIDLASAQPLEGRCWAWGVIDHVRGRNRGQLEAHVPLIVACNLLPESSSMPDSASCSWFPSEVTEIITLCMVTTALEVHVGEPRPLRPDR